MNPAEKYEASIFLATPSIYWVSLVFSLFIGFFIVIKFTFLDEKKIYKNSALLLLFIAFVSFLSIWIIRGYYLWGWGDPLTHLGKIKDVLLSGYIEKGNIYPITHIFLTQICSILNIDPIIPHKYIPLWFSILYLIFMYLFVKETLISKREVIFALLVAIIPMGGFFLNLTPNGLANLTLPLVFFLVLKYKDNRRYEWSLLLIFLCFYFTLFHLLVSLVLLLIIFSLSYPVLKSVESLMRKYFKINLTFGKIFSVGIAIILFIWIFTWASSFYVWEHTIKNLYMLLTEGASTKLSNLVSDAIYAHSYGYSVIEQFLKVYGGLCVYLLLTAIGFIILWKKIKKNEVSLKHQNLLILTIPLIFIIAFMVLLYFTNIVYFSPRRLEIYIIMFSIPIIGYVLYEYINNRQSLIRTLSVSLLLVFLFIIAGMKTYPSPYVLDVNYQITKAEYIGMSSLFPYINNKIPITSLAVNVRRYKEVVLTKHERAKVVGWKDNLTIPFHFGYNENNYLGNYYTEDVYMVLNDYGRIIYKEIYPEIAELRFTDDDFAQIEKDNTITKFYANGGFDSYCIRSYKGA
jgi:hypothetical protein